SFAEVAGRDDGGCARRVDARDRRLRWTAARAIGQAVARARLISERKTAAHAETRAGLTRNAARRADPGVAARRGQVEARDLRIIAAVVTARAREHEARDRQQPTA